MDNNNYSADIYYCIYILHTVMYETFTLILIKKTHRNKSEKTFRKNVKRCRDDCAKKHSNKMPKSLQTRCRNGGMQSGEGCMMAVNTSYTYVHIPSSRNGEMLLLVLQNIRFLARQGLPLRGDGNECGSNSLSSFV